MRDMFFDCTSLVSLDVSSWDTSRVCETDYMFSNCKSLKTLDASRWPANKKIRHDPHVRRIARDVTTR
jgi:surface protein